jgi:hypothetical protein
MKAEGDSTANEAVLKLLIADIDSRADQARKAVRAANHAVWFCSLRYGSTSFGLPPWVAALIVSSVAAGAGAAMLIGAGVTGSAILLSWIFGAYAVFGVAGFALIRDKSGEHDGTRRLVRARQLGDAKAARDTGAELLLALEREAAGARDALEAVNASAVSAVNTLLKVEVGRLYPPEFEQFTADVFKMLGYSVRRTGQTGDQGVDVVAEKPGRRLAIQVKCYSNTVGNSSVQEVFAGMMHYRCNVCVVVTNNYFTKSATALAASTGCVLIDRDSIPQVIRGELIV